MADDKESGGSGWLPNARNLFLMLILGTLFAGQAPFHESRPKRPDTNVNVVKDIDARPWQDPFEAVDKYCEENKNSKSWDTLDEFPKSVRNKLTAYKVGDPSAKAIDVVAVMLPGTDYFEDGEIRRKLRYAVLSGFNTALRYMPKDSNYIHFFHQEPNPKAQNAEAKTEVGCNVMKKQRVVYEWLVYKPTNNQISDNPNERVYQYPPILVLWLNSENYAVTPHQKLHDLIDKLGPIGHVSVLGPYDSQGLQDLVDEVADIKHNSESDNANSQGLQDFSNVTATNKCTKADFANYQYYSPNASAWEHNFFKDNGSSIPTNGNDDWNLQHNFAKQNLQFLRVTGTDDKLAKEVAEELKLRGAKPGKHNRVLLIGEWDSYYTWHLTNTFTDQLLQSTDDCKIGDTSEKQDWKQQYNYVNQCIFRASYLRGLDGENLQTDRASNKSSDGDKKSIDAKMKARENLEAASGNSQFDYVRRLAQQTEELDRRIRAKNWDVPDAHAIKAIGILGSDVYDKLLISEALHDKFPDAVFFTNGMDARFLEPKHNQWARNMVIASSFGLTLNDWLQKYIPPFRDSSQTAYFLATELALTKQSAGNRSGALLPEYFRDNLLPLTTMGWQSLFLSYNLQRNFSQPPPVGFLPYLAFLQPQPESHAAFLSNYISGELIYGLKLPDISFQHFNYFSPPLPIGILPYLAFLQPRTQSHATFLSNSVSSELFYDSKLPNMSFRYFNYLSPPLSQGWIDDLTPIRIFEIGSTKAFDLNSSSFCGPGQNPSIFHPCIDKPNWVLRVFFVIGLIVIFLLYAFTTPREFLGSISGLEFVSVITVVCYSIPLWVNFLADASAPFPKYLYGVFALFYVLILTCLGLFQQAIGQKTLPGNLYYFVNLLLIAFNFRVLWCFTKPSGLLDSELNGEPYALLEGVSMWPSHAIRLVGFILASYFILEVSRLPNEFGDWFKQQFKTNGRKATLEKKQAKANAEKNHYTFASCWSQIEKILAPAQQIINDFLNKRDSNKRPLSKIIDAWADFWPRWSSALIVSAILYGLGSALFYFLGIPHVPFRGENMLILHNVMMQGLLVPTYLLLLVLVIQATIKVTNLVSLCIPDEEKKGSKMEWPNKSLIKYAERFNLSGCELSEWAGMEVVVELTKGINKIIGYPLIIALLMVLSRSSYFDDWQMPMALKLIFGVSLGCLLYFDYRLKKAADEARDKALESLHNRIIKYKGMGEPFKAKIDQLKDLTDLIEKHDEGSYKGFTQRPIFLNSLIIVLALLADSFDFSLLGDSLRW